MPYEYIARQAIGVDELQRELNLLEEEGFEVHRCHVTGFLPSVSGTHGALREGAGFAVIGRRRYRICSQDGCGGRGYYPHIHCERCRMESRDLRLRHTGEECVVSGCAEFAEMTFYCDDHEREAAKHWAARPVTLPDDPESRSRILRDDVPWIISGSPDDPPASPSFGPNRTWEGF